MSHHSHNAHFFRKSQSLVYTQENILMRCGNVTTIYCYLIVILSSIQACNYLFQSVTLSLVVPAVLSHYNGVVEQLEDVKFLRKLLTTLRDRIKYRFAGIFVNLKMSFTADPSKDAFNSKVYLAAAILDPNLKLHWLEDVNIPTDPEYDEDSNTY